MNPLRELLEGQQPASKADVRAATTASLIGLRHDRRVEVLTFEQVGELANRLFNSPDIRTLMHETRRYSREDYEESLAHAEAYVHQMLFEVAEEEGLLDPQVRRMQQLLAARGGQMRIVPEVPFRATLYDRALALIPRDFDDNSAGAIAVREPELVLALVAVHADLWRGGRRWGAALSGARGAQVDLSDVLAHLLDGHTDEAAAQHLHISLRTYRRRVQELLRLLRVQTRFQAGVIAAERRYIDLVRPSAPGQTGPNPYLEALDQVR